MSFRARQPKFRSQRHQPNNFITPTIHPVCLCYSFFFTHITELKQILTLRAKCLGHVWCCECCITYIAILFPLLFLGSMSHYSLCSDSSLTMPTRYCVHSANNTAADISSHTVCRLTIHHPGLSSCKIQCTPKGDVALTYGAAWISSGNTLHELSQSRVGRYGRIPSARDLWSWQTQWSRIRGNRSPGWGRWEAII